MNCPKCDENRFRPIDPKTVKCLKCGTPYNPSNGKIDPKLKTRYEIDRLFEELAASVKEARDAYILEDEPRRALQWLDIAKKKTDQLFKKVGKVEEKAHAPAKS